MITKWKDYLNHPFPKPTQANREAVEAEAGYALPEAYWTLVAEHQGHMADPDNVPRADGKPDERMGVLLYALPTEQMEGTKVYGYGLLVALDNMASLYPAGIVPFSDDTGGNNLAFDFRTGPDPAVVFVDHNVAGERGLTRVAPSFQALLEMLR